MWPFQYLPSMWPLRPFKPEERLSILTPTTADQAAFEAFWDRLVAAERHEDTLFNARFQAFVVATAFIMAAMSQFREDKHILLVLLLCLTGMGLAAIAYRVLSRTARTIEWYLDALTRLDIAVFKDPNHRVYAARKRCLGELVVGGDVSIDRFPVSVLLGAWVPAFIGIVWLLLMIATVRMHGLAALWKALGI